MKTDIIITVALAMVLITTLSACGNTVAGIGKDIVVIGEGIAKKDDVDAK